jgi:integrase
MTTTTTTEATSDTPTKARAKRKRSRGSVYQRSDGRWCGEVVLKNGKRKYVYGKTAADVDEKLTATKQTANSGAPVADGRLTVADVLEAFMDEREQRVRDRTLAAYRRIVDDHIKPYIGTRRMHDLTRDDVQAFITRRTRGGLSAAMAHHVLVVVRMAFKHAVEGDRIPRNVAAGVKGPKVERPELAPLEADDTAKLLAAAREHPLGAIWFLAASLGLRRGEVLGLRFRDVDLEGGTVTIRHQLAGAGDKAVLVPPKTKRGIRSLALNAAVVALLKTRKARQAEEKLAAGELWQNALGLIFTGEQGQPLEGATVFKIHKRLCKAAKVRRVRFHDLRHGAATLMLEAGVDPASLSATLGHSRVGFTLDTYVHVRQPKVDDAVGALAGVLGLGAK